MYRPQGKILDQYYCGDRMITVTQTEEQVIINNPPQSDHIPRVDLRQRTFTPQPVNTNNVPGGKSYSKYLHSDGMNIGISIVTDMDY